jgi:hypothetical protein
MYHGVARRGHSAQRRLNPRPDRVIRLNSESLPSHLGQHHLHALPANGGQELPRIHGASGNQLGRGSKDLGPIEGLQMTEGDHKVLVRKFLTPGRNESLLRLPSPDDHAGPAGIRHVQEPVLNAGGVFRRMRHHQLPQAHPKRRYRHGHMQAVRQRAFWCISHDPII